MKLSRILIIVIAAMLIKLVTSCFLFDCNCPEPLVIGMEFNRVRVCSTDNPNFYSTNFPVEQKILPAKAVAFFIELSDTLNREYYNDFAKCKVAKPVWGGFNSAMAFSCDCNETDFFPKKVLQSISIFTRYPINDSIVPGNDITHLFLGRQENVYDTSNLYQTIGEITDYHNKIAVYDEPITAFSIYLKGEVQNDSLQLDINFNFDDNSCISTTTSTIYLTHNP